MRACKTIFGILSLVFVLLIWFQSCAVGIGNTVIDPESDAASIGFFIGLVMLVGGISGIVTRDSQVGGIITGIIYLLGSAVALDAEVGIYQDLVVWGWFSFVCGLIFCLGSLFPSKSKSPSPAVSASSAPSAPSSSDNLEQLEQLFKLKEKGILTQDEFDAKKKELLNSK